MGIFQKVKVTKVYEEFSEEERKKWFNLKEKKTISHIDSFYYSVFLQSDSEIKENVSPNINMMIDCLNEMKVKLEEEKEEFWFDLEKTLVYSRKKTGLYTHCISMPGMFDIFIANYLPNGNTPRVHIQIRSNALWSWEEHISLNYSYSRLLEILEQFDIKVLKVQENRIDYCYHTNILQNPQEQFSDEKLCAELHTKFRIGQKVFRFYKGVITNEYLALGNRKSNNVFFRAYNKTREVVEQQYKDFFFNIWLENGLISKYDYYCLCDCFYRQRYDSIEHSMMMFYINHGKDDEIKERFKKIYDNPKSTIKQVRNAVNGVVPYPTVILNVEFQTMRKFYFSSDEIIYNGLNYKTKCHKELHKLFRIVDNRKIFLDYLTANTVSFVRPNVEDKTEEKKYYTDFWWRIRNTKVDGFTKSELNRQYNYTHSINLVVRKLKSNLATLSLYCEKDGTDILEDMSCLISQLNDNDQYTLEDGTIKVIDPDYVKIKEKRKKALNSYLNKQPLKDL